MLLKFTNNLCYNAHMTNSTNFYYNKELQVLYKKSCNDDKPMLQSIHLSKRELESLYFFLYTELIEQDIEDGKFVI